MTRVFLPYVELLWKRIPAPLEQIKEAGFDGVECVLIGGLRSSERIRRLREETAELGLDIRFHQGWSWETGQRILHNFILRPLGALVPVGMPLVEEMRDIGTDPVVIYGNLVGEPARSNYLYQTASLRIHGRADAMAFPSYLSAVKSFKLLVAFDTQHVLEWALHKESVADLPTCIETIGQALEELWQDLGPLTREIHLCDFDPRLGPSHGRNVFLGDGISPLAQFCAGIRASGWDGVVTPEVSPQHLRGKGLRMLREKVDQLFSL